MKPTMHLFVLVLAMVLFFLAAIGVPEHPRLHYIGAGLFLWALAAAMGAT